MTDSSFPCSSTILNFTISNPIIEPVITSSSDTVVFGSSVTLSSNSLSNSLTSWYSDSLGNNLIGVGDNLITPQLHQIQLFMHLLLF